MLDDVAVSPQEDGGSVMSASQDGLDATAISIC